MSTLTLTKRQGSLLFWLWIAFWAIGLAVGVYAGLQVIIQGLGITNLSDHAPWGLWIVADLSSIALGAGAFTLSAVVYIFKMKRYEAIARAAVFVGLLGYSSAMLALLIDIGRPDRFYHPIIYWNIHSVLWEITMCVVLYSTVLVLELVPIIIESTPLHKNRFLHALAHGLHRVMPVVAVAGMGLSLLHQSSLGATYGILTARPVWYSPSQPVLFILSAVAAGPSLTLFLTLLAGWVTNRQMVPRDIINGVARLIGFACLAYLYLKLWSWLASYYYSRLPERTLNIELLNLNTPYGFTFWLGEVFFGALVPAVIMLWPRLRNNRFVLMLGTLLIIAGLVVNRWNVTLSGFVVPFDWSPGTSNIFPISTYEPALIEWGIVLGLISYGWLAFSLGVRFLRLYPEAKPFKKMTTEIKPIVLPPADQPQPVPGTD